MPVTLWQSELVRKSPVVLRDGLDEAEAQKLLVLLASAGIEADAARSGRAWRLLVSLPDADRARELLREQDEGSELDRWPPGEAGRPPEGAPGWFGRGTAAVALVAALCIGAFALCHRGFGPSGASRMLACGAISWQRVEAGELWRLVTAIFLHFDLVHLLLNLTGLLVLGPPLAREIGSARFVACFVIAGAAGNALSHLWAPAVGLKAGASGGIAGILGALGGVSLRARPARGRFRRWHVIGALAAIYAMLIGFGPGRDNAAHLGGLVAGVGLGWAFTKSDSGPAPQDVLRARELPRR
ncbi:MAG: rhomboid family intramembrane serine protease [Candidatus Dadabacteria bacterium]|nr:MAG: rhomboid family intramembrane serine protease [Candidatus Dadabacteria bacterium]